MQHVPTELAQPQTNRAQARQLFAKPVWVVAALMILWSWFTLPGVIGRAPFGDELRTWNASVRQPYAKIFKWQNNADHAPLSYLLVKATVDLAGTDAGWALRLPAFMCGLLCIPAAFWLGRSVGGNAVGMLVAALAAVDPNLVWQSQQARMYPHLLLIMLLGLTALLRLAATPRVARPIIWRWIILGMILGIGMWTHASSLALWLGTAALATMLAWDARRQGGGVWRIILSAALAMSVVLLMSSPALFRLGGMVEREAVDSQFVRGAFRQLKSLTREVTGERAVTVALCAVVLGTYITQIVAARRAGRGPAAMVVLLVVWVGLLGSLIIAAQWRPVHGVRYLTAAYPSFWIGLALAATAGLQHRRRAVRWSVIALGGALLISQGYRSAYADTIFRTHDYADELRQAISWVKANAKPDDAVAYSPPMPGLVYAYYELRPTPVDAASRPQTTYVIVVWPENHAPGGPAQRPPQLLPALARSYRVSVDMSLLPAEMLSQVRIYRFSADGSQAYDHTGRLLASQ